MVKLARLLAGLAFLWGTAVCAAPISDEQVKSLSTASGLPETIEAMRRNVVAGYRQMAGQGGAAPAKKAERAVRVFEQMLDAGEMKAVVLASVAASLDAEEAGSLLSWYGSALGLKVTAGDLKFIQQPPAPEQVAEDLDALIAAGPARGDLVKRYTEASLEVEQEAAFTMRFMRFMMQAKGREGASPPPAETAELLAKLKPQILAQSKARTLPRNARRFKDLSDPELEALIGIVARPEQRHFNAVVVQALGDALEQAMTRFMEFQKRELQDTEASPQCVPEGQDV